MIQDADRWPKDGSLQTICLNALQPREFLPADHSSIWCQSVRFSAEPQRSSAWLVTAPSGTGKSSLVSYLNGLRSDFRGNIEYLVQTPTASVRLSTDTMVEQAWSGIRRFGMATVFQDFRLIPWLSAWDNLFVSPWSRGSAAADPVRKESMLAWYDRMEIRASIQSQSARLSRGEQQRLAIIRALATGSRFLVLDEAFSHLDRRLRALVARVIGAHCQSADISILAFDLDRNEDFPWDGVYVLDGQRS